MVNRSSPLIKPVPGLSVGYKGSPGSVCGVPASRSSPQLHTSEAWTKSLWSKLTMRESNREQRLFWGSQCPEMLPLGRLHSCLLCQHRKEATLLDLSHSAACGVACVVASLPLCLSWHCSSLLSFPGWKC